MKVVAETKSRYRYKRSKCAINQESYNEVTVISKKKK